MEGTVTVGWLEVLSFAGLLLALSMLRKLIGILPSLTACLIRGKENINLESSVKLSLDRDTIAAVMIIPFLVMAFTYRLYDPDFLSEMEDGVRFLTICGILVSYVVIRIILIRALRPQKISGSIYTAAFKSGRTFFIILTLLLLATAGITSLTGMDYKATTNTMLCISAITYTLFVLRKTQIFAHGASVLTAFLYLCALEIAPTAILIASAVVF